MKMGTGELSEGLQTFGGFFFGDIHITDTCSSYRTSWFLVLISPSTSLSPGFTFGPFLCVLFNSQMILVLDTYAVRTEDPLTVRYELKMALNNQR